MVTISKFCLLLLRVSLASQSFETPQGCPSASFGNALHASEASHWLRSVLASRLSSFRISTVSISVSGSDSSSIDFLIAVSAFRLPIRLGISGSAFGVVIVHV